MFRESAHLGAAATLFVAFALELYCEARGFGAKTPASATTSAARGEVDASSDGARLLDRAASPEDVERGKRSDDEEVVLGADASRGLSSNAARGGASAYVAPAMRCLMLDPKALRASRAAIQAWAELGVIMFLFWFCDRTGLVRDAKKSYDRDLMLSIFAALGAYGWRVTLKESRTTSSLHREQTEEMKGWMQVLFLLYHYFDAGEMYNLIRVFIAAYVWMTGYGNFSYYYVKKDFTATRFAQMMWRLNFFVFVTCVVMKNDYMLYYICPMHTLFTLFVYFALAIGREKNAEPKWIWIKMAACGVVSACLWEIPGLFRRVFAPFTFVFGYVNPAHPEVKPLHEWQFRSGLDRYVWIYGMLCAYTHPTYDAVMKWIDERPTRARAMYQTGIVAFAVGTLYWWWITFMTMDKHKYNMYHPYTSWIPLTAFFLLRNATKTLRANHIDIFCVCGKVTLETYIAQFHIWLSTSDVPNGSPKMLMSLLPGYPLLNFMVCSYIFIGISHRIFDVTNILKSACIPSNGSREVMIQNAIFGGLVLATTMGIGVFCSLLFTGKT